MLRHTFATRCLESGMNINVVAQLQGIARYKLLLILIKPLFGLLQTGYYALIDTELSPTNGNGGFFVEYLVQDDSTHPEIKKIIDSYFNKYI